MSYLSDKQSVTRETLPLPPPGYIHVVGRKHRCGHAWCPSCGVRVVRRALWEVRDWDWSRVRTVMVSLDRALFPSGPEAALDALEKERSAFVRELNRRGAEVEQFVWFCEWHEDGYPHYHFLMLVRQRGKAGQIGGDRIRESWRYGQYVYEAPIKSKAHWDAWVGYAAKTGYLHKDGNRQVMLPGWAQESARRVRRTGSSQAPEPSPEAAPLDLAEFIRKFGKRSAAADGAGSKPAAKTNRQVLESCGCRTHVLALINVKGEAQDYGECCEPYRDFTARPGVYLERFGWCVTMRVEDFVQYYREYSPPPEKTRGSGEPERGSRATGSRPAGLDGWAAASAMADAMRRKRGWS